MTSSTLLRFAVSVIGSALTALAEAPSAGSLALPAIAADAGHDVGVADFPLPGRIGWADRVALPAAHVPPGAIFQQSQPNRSSHRARSRGATAAKIIAGLGLMAGGGYLIASEYTDRNRSPLRVTGNRYELNDDVKWKYYAGGAMVAVGVFVLFR